MRCDYFWINLLLQNEHLYGFSFVWVLMCLVRLLLTENLLSQNEHLNGFSLVWVLMWILRSPNWKNLLSHSLQTNDLILSWTILTCVSKSPRLKKNFSTNVTFILILFSVNRLNVFSNIAFRWKIFTTSITFVSFNAGVSYTVKFKVCTIISWIITFSTSKLLLHWSIKMISFLVVLKCFVISKNFITRWARKTITWYSVLLESYKGKIRY